MDERLPKGKPLACTVRLTTIDLALIDGAQRMGKASIRAELDGIGDLIQQWTQAQGFSFPESATNTPDLQAKLPAGSVQLKSASIFYTAQWRCQPDDAGCTVHLDVKPKLFLVAVLTAAQFAGLWYVVHLIGILVDQLLADEFLLLVGATLVTVLLVWLKHFRLPIKLSRLENTFWDCIAGKYDTRRLTRATGAPESRNLRLATQLLLVAVTVYIGFVTLGILGAVCLFLVCMPFFLMVVAETVRRDDPQWSWRFWIMANMARWTFVMISILGIAVLLFSWDIVEQLELHRQEEPPPSIGHALLQGRLRSISPAIAALLEEDAKRAMNEIVEKAVLDYGGETDEERAEYRSDFELFARILQFSIVSAATVFFAVIPFHGILTSHRIWKDEVGTEEIQQGPCVPYLPQAWKWRIPRGLRYLVVLHYVFGGILNVAAAVFSVDGMIYAISGRTLLIERSANLWSLMFASCKMLWGDPEGQLIGTLFTFIIAMPFLMLFATHLRRAARRTALMVRVLFARRDDDVASSSKASFARLCMRDMCSESAIKEPVLVFAKRRDVGICLYWTVLNARAVIEITDGALELLAECELRAAIAHELGHVKQGLLKVEVLKLLSSVALFPNHYLTLCLNWSGNEMRADRFALEATNDPHSLKQALIITSTDQMSYLNDSVRQRRRRFSNHWPVSTIRKKWLSILASVRFFWGDSLFGYAHPYLSERIKIIDAFAMEENGA